MNPQKRITTRHLPFLIAFPLIGPMIPALLLTVLFPERDIGASAWALSYTFGIIPASITGLIVTLAGLRRNRRGIAITTLCGGLTTVIATIYSHINGTDALIIAAFGAISAFTLALCLPTDPSSYQGKSMNRFLSSLCWAFLGGFLGLLALVHCFLPASVKAENSAL